MDANFQLATRFTLRQLERLCELVSAEAARQPSPEDYNLARKLQEYLANGYHLVRLRRTG
jgi:hypothetical protein